MEADQFETIDESTDEHIGSDETVGVVLEEAEIVDCDADVEVEDDNVQYHLYALNRDDNTVNTVAYKVMHVRNNDREENELSVATPVNTSVQVLTSSLNGQLYVLSNSNDAVTSESARVVPSVAKLQIEAAQSIVNTVKKRDERRRVTHNEVERRRRDKISNWISKLAKLLSECEQDVNKEKDVKPNLEPQSKGGILARAYEYIIELKDTSDKLTQTLQEKSQLRDEVKNLREAVNQLRDENSQLKAQLSKQENICIIGI